MHVRATCEKAKHLSLFISCNCYFIPEGSGNKGNYTSGILKTLPAICTIKYAYTLLESGFGTQVRGFKPGRSRRIFQGEKILSTPSFGREVKSFVPCRIFAACKRTRKCMCGNRSFRSKLPAISRPSCYSFHY